MKKRASYEKVYEVIQGFGKSLEGQKFVAVA